jgi:hypothetical protein
MYVMKGFYRLGMNEIFRLVYDNEYTFIFNPCRYISISLMSTESSYRAFYLLYSVSLHYTWNVIFVCPDAIATVFWSIVIVSERGRKSISMPRAGALLTVMSWSVVEPPRGISQRSGMMIPI